MKLLFKILKCQAKGCKEKATQTFNDGKVLFCDYHYRLSKARVAAEMKWIEEQDEKWLRGEYRGREDNQDLI